MNVFLELLQDVARLWTKYYPMYLRGIGSTLSY